MHAEKTTMVFSREHVECNVEIAGQRLTNVREHAGPLGMAQSDDSKMECELERRIGAVMRTAGAVRSQVFETENRAVVQRCWYIME